jgi:hypothetical protein
LRWREPRAATLQKIDKLAPLRLGNAALVHVVIPTPYGTTASIADSPA